MVATQIRMVSALCMVAVTATAAAAADIPFNGFETVGRSLTIDSQATAGSDGVLARMGPLRFGNARFVSLQIRVSGPAQGLSVELRGGFGQAAVTHDAANFGGEGGWSDAVPIPVIEVAILGTAAPTSPVEIAVLTARTAQPTGQADGAINTVNLEPVNSDLPALLRAAARKVARLAVTIDNPYDLNFDKQTQTCTGFLIGPDLLMTNYHCVKSETECESTLVVFGYDHDLTATMDAARCAALEYATPVFDTTILRLDRQVGHTRGHFLLTDAKVDGQLVAIGHPQGVRMRVARDSDCKADRWDVAIATDDPQIGAPHLRRLANRASFTHGCDTASGSSGSPIIDPMGNVVGMQYYTKVPPYPEHNRAVWMAAILDCVTLRQVGTNVQVTPDSSERCRSRPATSP